MKNKFYKKMLLSIILITMLVLISTGCGGTGGGGGTIIPVVPTTFTVTVVSQHRWCYGSVYVAGSATSAYLLSWGSATVYNVQNGAAIYLVDTNGLQSQTIYFNAALGTIIVFDNWWGTY